MVLNRTLRFCRRRDEINLMAIAVLKDKPLSPHSLFTSQPTWAMKSGGLLHCWASPVQIVAGVLGLGHTEQNTERG